jgi:hypothetical protein
LARDVVHRQVVHVGLDELKGLIFDHLDGLFIKLCAQFVNLFALEASMVLVIGKLEDLLKDLLDI